MNAFEETNNVYLRLNLIRTMKLIFALGVIVFALAGCKEKKIAPKYLTSVSVVRETEEAGNSPKNAPVSSEAVSNITPVSPAAGTGEQTSGQERASSQYHIIVRSYGPSRYKEAQEMVRKLKEQKYPAMLINKDKRFRVSIEHFSNKTDADNACAEYRRITENNDIWVLFLK